MNYRWIDYPASISPELKAKYEALADQIEAAATEPIALVWAHPNESWTDDNGVTPEPNCLLVTQHIKTGGPDDEMTFGLNLSSHKLWF